MRPSGCGADCGGRRTRRGRPVDGVADAAVGAVHPRLEVGHGAMGARQQLLAGLGALAARAVVAAELREPVVARPAVSVDDRPGGGGRLRERPQRAARGVGQDLKAKPPRALPADLDRDPAERLLARLAPAPAPFLEPAEVQLVDLNLVLQRLTLGARPSPGAASAGSDTQSHSATAPAGAEAAWPRSPDGGWRPGRRPRTRRATACASCASRCPRSPTSAGHTPRTPTDAGARAPKPPSRHTPGRRTPPASARRPGTQGMPPRSRTAPGTP